jgi:hypothetical protein
MSELGSCAEAELAPVSKLAAGFDFRGEQTNVIDARAVCIVDDGSYVLPGNAPVGFDEEHLLSPCLVDIDQLIIEILPAHSLLIELKLWLAAWSGEHLQNHRSVALLRLGMFRRRLRNQRIFPSRCHRGNNHKNDKQSQQHVNQWCHIHAAENAAT